MSQKQIVPLLKKHHFWILTGLAAITAIGISWMAFGSLAKTFDERKAAIEQKYTAASGVKNKSPHPNDSTHAEMQKLVTALQQEVRQVWDSQYLHQRDAILVWPTELRPELLRRVRDLRPIEATVEFPTPPEKEIPAVLRENYRDYIKEELPKLAKIIGAEWKVSLQSRGGGGAYSAYGDSSSDSASMQMSEYGGAPGGGARSKDPEFIVDWESGNQGKLQNNRFDWGGNPPSTLQMLYAQEDLWVLRAIMEIIAKTNEGADSHFKAAIKTISAIELGADAGGRTGRVIRPKGAAGAGGEGGSDMYSAMSSESMMSGSGDSSGASSESASMAMPDSSSGGMMMGGQPGKSADPGHLRYVDKDYKPLTGAELRSAQTDNAADKSYLAVAKRMPVRLRLSMDQRKVHKLLTECGNSPLTLEVRQVRINGSATPSSSGGYGGGGATSESSSDGATMSYGSGGMSGGGGSSQSAVQTQFDLPVEIFGIIYIYNPANLQKLGIDPNQDKVAMRP